MECTSSVIHFAEMCMPLGRQNASKALKICVHALQNNHTPTYIYKTVKLFERVKNLGKKPKQIRLSY